MKKKPILLLSICFLVILLFVSALLLKYTEELSAWKQNIRNRIDSIRNPQPAKPEISDFASHTPMQNTGNEWYFSSRIIAHACGGIDGLDYTNSKEALEFTLEKGIRNIEVDFRYTSDGTLVCVHEWEDFHINGKTPTLSEFLSSKVYGKYTPLRAEDIISTMEQYDDLYIVIDTKEANTVEVVRDLVALCNGQNDVISRLIIQLYDRNIKQQMLEIYPFNIQNFLFSAYKFGSFRTAEIIELCYKEDIRIITIPKEKWTNETISFFREKGFHIFEHTENRPDYAKAALDRGVCGIYTDFLTEADLIG